MSEPPKIIGSEEAARILGKSPRTVQRLANTGEIPVIMRNIGRRTEYAFDAAVIEEIAHKEEDNA
jgi:phage terminase Nu1 subunit (DNA packaging protein)